MLGAQFPCEAQIRSVDENASRRVQDRLDNNPGDSVALFGEQATQCVRVVDRDDIDRVVESVGTFLGTVQEEIAA